MIGGGGGVGHRLSLEREQRGSRDASLHDLTAENNTPFRLYRVSKRAVQRATSKIS